MQAYRRRNSQPGYPEIRVIGADGHVCLQSLRLCAARDKGNHDVAVRTDGFSKTHGWTHFGTGKVIEGKGDEYDSAASH
jgi:hypothetical protein